MPKKTIFNGYRERVALYMARLDSELIEIQWPNGQGKAIIYSKINGGILFFVMLEPEPKRHESKFRISLGWSRDGSMPDRDKIIQALINTFVQDRIKTSNQNTVYFLLPFWFNKQDLFWDCDVLNLEPNLHKIVNVYVLSYFKEKSEHPFFILEKCWDNFCKLPFKNK